MPHGKKDNAVHLLGTRLGLQSRALHPPLCDEGVPMTELLAEVAAQGIRQAMSGVISGFRIGEEGRTVNN